MKLRSCPSDTERLPSEGPVASHTACVCPQSLLQGESFAASKFAGRSLRPEVLNRSHETGGSRKSFSSRKTPHAVGKSQTKQAVNAILQNERIHAPIVTSTLGKREEVSPVKMQPCPPSNSRDKDRHTVNTFRERKFKGEYYGSSLSSEGNSSRKRGEYTEKRSNPETITVGNFIVDPPSSAMRPLIDSGVEFEFEEDYEVKNNIRSPLWAPDNIQERCDVNISDCITEARKGFTSPRTTRLTIRKQANTDCKMSRAVSKVTQYCYQRALVPSPLDEFARRQLGCNLKLCRKNLELNESFTAKTCKNTTTEIMINNWLIGIPRVK